MHTLQYTIRFYTPAFLGDARQSGRWRTPPLKAQLRQWWRVAYAADKQFAVNVNEMRQAEGVLFGFAGDDGDQSAGKSKLRLRLGSWEPGKLQRNQWSQNDPTAHHLEVGNGGRNVGSQLYMGFGPVEYHRESRRTGLKANAAIQAGEHTTLRIAVPDAHKDPIRHALWLMHRFGTVGGRSRNGWGSYTLEPFQQGVTTDTAGGWNNTPALPELPLRLWTDCLNLDWAHALGKDNTGALIWQTQAHADWQSLMQELAKIKIGLRTQFPFNTGKNAPITESRHYLSYPVTNHSVAAWGGNARLPNTLRFKVCPDPEDNEKLRGIIFHVPCLPPASFAPKVQQVQQTWEKVHRWLDNSQVRQNSPQNNYRNISIQRVTD